MEQPKKENSNMQTYHITSSCNREESSNTSSWNILTDDRIKKLPARTQKLSYEKTQ